MKTKLFIVLLCTMLGGNTQAQFVDDMEYNPGEPLGVWWIDSGVNGIDIVEFADAHSGMRAGQLGDGGFEYQYLDLGNQTNGEWGLEFYAYIPAGNTGYLALMGEYALPGLEYIVGQFHFNEAGAAPGVGSITDTALGEVVFNYPEEEWFRIVMNFDLSQGIAQATWGLFIYQSHVIPTNTPFTNTMATPPTQLGAVEYFSINANHLLYVDSFNFQPEFIDNLGVSDLTLNQIVLFPNPSKDLINISANEPIERVAIFSSEGRRIQTLENLEIVDISALNEGMYFVQIETATGRQFQKFVKN